MKITIYGVEADIPEWAQWLAVQEDGRLLAIEEKPFVHEFPYGGAFWAIHRPCMIEPVGLVTDRQMLENWPMSLVSVVEAKFWHDKAAEVEAAAMFGQVVDGCFGQPATIYWPPPPDAVGYEVRRGEGPIPPAPGEFPSIETMAGHGVKADAGKPRVDLVPPAALLELGRVYGFGALKYQPNNWMKGMAWSRVYAASLRHMLAFWNGEDLDPESGLSHLAHAMFGMMSLFEYQELHPGLDDRPYTVINNEQETA